jgi:NTP pyrophosphatase (non-canonical NTP hydrolase)
MPQPDKKPSTTGMLSIQCREDSVRWFGDSGVAEGFPALMHHSLALAGEVGEFCNIVKKIDRGSLNLGDAIVRKDLAFELADVYIYTLNLAGLMGIDLEDLYKIKRAENDQRFMVQRRLREARKNAETNGHRPSD